MFHILFQCAMRWELIERNPIALIRQSTARRAVPRVLTPREFRALLKELEGPYKTMVLIAGCLGLRASEIMGLQWADIDWYDLMVFIGEALQASTFMKPKPRGHLNLCPSILTWRRYSCGIGGALRTRGPPTSFLLVSLVGLVGGAFCLPITSGPPRKELGSARSDGIRSGTHSQLWFTVWVPTWRYKRNCCGTRISRRR